MTSISVRMDETLKNDFSRICADLGMDMSTAITIFAKKVTREQRIPFDVSVDPFYSERNMRAIDEAIERMKQGRVVVKTMEELEAMENE